MEADVLNPQKEPSSLHAKNVAPSKYSISESYFGLNEKPFKLTPNPKYLFLSNPHKEALAHLIFGIQENKGFVLIFGEVGTGKTMLCRSFLNRLDSNVKAAYIFNPCLTDIELLQNINDELGISSDTESKKLLIDKLNQYLLEEKKQGNKVILVIDEAQNLAPSVLEQLRLLSNLETDTEKLIQIILIGQPELENILSRTDMRQLKQRITMDWELLPLNKSETSSYINHRIKIAGGNGKLTFAKGAINKIYKHTKGTPRLINVLSDRALIIAFALGKKHITSKIVHYAIKDIEKTKNKIFHQKKWVKVTFLAIFFLLAILALEVFIKPLQIRNKREVSNLDDPPRSPDEPIVPQIDIPPGNLSKPIVSQIDITPGNLSKPKVSQIDITPDILAEPIAPQIDIPPNNLFPKSGPMQEKSKSLMKNTKAEFDAFLNQMNNQSKLNSIEGILKVWNLEPLSPTEQAPIKFSQLEEKRGLSYFRITTNLKRLKQFNYPTVLKFQLNSPPKTLFLLLTKMRGDALFFLFKGKEVKASSEIIKEVWTGTAYIFWRNFDNIHGLLSNGSKGNEVVWLSKKLKELGFYEHNITEVFDNNLQKAVINFQEKNQLGVDGIVGKETIIIIYQLMENYKTPYLIKN